LNTIRLMTALIALAISSGPPASAKALRSPHDTVQRLFSAFNRHDLDMMARLYASDAIIESPDFCSARHGPEGVRKTYAELFRAFPDIVDQVTGYLVSGERIAVQFVAHSQRFEPAQGLRLATFFTIRDGLIVRDETYFDTRGQPCS
jgi:ketosteroid isomerase-like protein